MAQRISTKDTAKMIREALKAEFPTTKFSVRSSIYSGGSSINISWTDGPTQSQVDQIGKRFEGASFDGMIDLKSYHNSLITFPGDELPTEVQFGADFVFSNRSLSDEFKTELAKIAQSILDMNESTKGQTFDENAYYRNLGTNFDFAFDMGYGSNLLWKIAQNMTAEKVGA